MKRLTDPTFKYVPAVETNLSKTFARERARLKALAEQPSNVKPIKRKGVK